MDDRTGRLPGGAEREVQTQCAALVAAVTVDADEREVALRATDGQLEFPPGASGLRTARLTCVLRSSQDVDMVGATVTVTVEPATGGPGWREVTAVGDGVRLAGSTVSSESVSGALRAYPDELLEAPLDVRSAAFRVERAWPPGSGPERCRSGGRAASRRRPLHRWLHLAGGTGPHHGAVRWGRPCSSARCTPSHPATARP